MGDHEGKAALFDTLAEAAKALSNGRRVELIDVLSQGERSVEVLAEEIDQSVANTSQHLQRLLRAGLVKTRRDGTRIMYMLSSPAVFTLWRTMREATEAHVDELDAVARVYLGARDQLGTMTRDQLRKRLREGDIVVLDVRPRAEYDAGHIRGAVSVPVAELSTRLDEIPDGTDVVAYCRGPFCVYADDAVRVLETRGRSAVRLEDGFPEWAADKLPIERT